MTLIARIFIVFLVVLLPLSNTNADYLEVRRSATIKAEPQKDAQIIERVQEGTLLELLDRGQQTNGYYHVNAVSVSGTGWVYRTLVRRRSGDIPQPTAEAVPQDPLADPTLMLTDEQRTFAARHLRIGKPQAVYERVREAYVLAQDGRLKISLWVQYELSQQDLQGTATRTDNFRADTSIPFGYRSELSDYSSSGFDRGHMAPAGDMKRSEQVMSESFFLSNMVAQVGSGFNRHIWKYLEDAVRGWVEQRGTLTIITGPVFAVEGGRVSYQVIGNGHVAVPTHFYKIIVDVNDPDNVQALAFVLPNESLTGHEYSEFLTSIDEIEAATGLDFLSALPVGVQDRVESVTAGSVW